MDEVRGTLERLRDFNVAEGRDTPLPLCAFAKKTAIPYATLHREPHRGLTGHHSFNHIREESFSPFYSAKMNRFDTDDKNAQMGTGMHLTHMLAAALYHTILTITIGKSNAHAPHHSIAIRINNVP